MITKKVFGHPFETYAVTTDVTEISELKYFAAAKESKQLTFSYLLEKDDIVYGLGEMMRGLNKRGGRYISYNKDDANHVDSNPSLYASHNFLVFFILKDRLIPVGKDVKNTGEIDFEQLFLLGDGREYALYADDGLSRDYSMDHIRMLYKI